MSAKGSLMYVIRVHTYLMKALSKIKFRDPWSATKFIQEFVNGWQQKTISNGDYVEGKKVYTYAP